MRHLFVIVSLSLLVFNISFAQTATVKGVIKDGGNGELLENATVLQPPTNGTASDIRGAYELKVNPGSVTIVISYLGMKADTQTFNIKAGEVKTLNVNLGGNA
ncbi:MAG: carboxypeptidase-like regulatory domain-containing protein, partial [Bacteroidetes bacterium]|nr:carboxypeptidase-like regulatory domain-containing protein [Bacteroidota bacterium]